MNNGNFSPINGSFLEEIYERFLADPSQVDSSWAQYFASLDSIKPEVKKNDLTSNSLLPYKSLLHYRQYGHLAADLDPLARQKKLKITITESEEEVSLAESFFDFPLSFEQFQILLKKTYSGFLAFEFEQLPDEEKNWLYKKVEREVWKLEKLFDQSDKESFLTSLLQTKLFENYLHTKFVGAKRFSVEGTETGILSLQELIRLSASQGFDQVFLGMAHRGRLSSLIQVMGKAPSTLFAGFMGYETPSPFPSFVGDVKYHLGYNKTTTIDGKKIKISLAYNPSHLESVNPVLMGMARAQLDQGKKVLPILVHGDGSFAGQGIVMESLAMSSLDAYNLEGVVHIILNNQIAFTTPPEQDRGTPHASDIAKGLGIPIIHVRADKPEEVIYATRLALAYRQEFKKDIVIDLIGYRKYGHNEGDEPLFTNPGLYNTIHQFKDVVERYKVENFNLELKSKEYLKLLDEQYELAKKLLSGEEKLHQPEVTPLYQDHIKIEQDLYKFKGEGDLGLTVDIPSKVTLETGFNLDKLSWLLEKISTVPGGFNLNNKIARLFEARLKNKELDWGTAENLALGSLLIEGINLRFTGEDVERGTFSHRHALLTDQKTDEKYCPLNNLEQEQKAKIYISNSFLSEFAVLGYEYGYSLERLEGLTFWEAQFGDFANGAQIIIDQFLVAAESKWELLSNLVLLLPHGYEGQGPEHSSAKLERFLQLAAQNNIQICNCTTPANFFHLLRRQAHQKMKKPLIVMTPKSLLRHKLAISKLEDLAEGRKFQPIIAEALEGAEKLVFSSGKVYYDLLEKPQEKRALIRVEQLYPTPIDTIKTILNSNPSAEIIWCQEEPENMGAYSFIKPVLEGLAGGRKLVYAGRRRAASPAVGFTKLHQSEIESYV
jgi:2-oxoglutarate dehydrogenase E1 component